MKRLLFALTPLMIFVGLILMFATNINRDPQFIPSVLLNKPAPEFNLQAVQGIDRPGFETQTLTGQVSVVNVFASWCIPCRAEHPFLVELGQTHSDIQLLGLNQKDAPENSKYFLEELGNPYHAIGADHNGRVSIEWGVYGVPETFVVNAQGIITYKHTGPLSEHSYKTSLLPAIEAAKQ